MQSKTSASSFIWRTTQFPSSDSNNLRRCRCLDSTQLRLRAHHRCIPHLKIRSMIVVAWKCFRRTLWLLTLILKMSSREILRGTRLLTAPTTDWCRCERRKSDLSIRLRRKRTFSAPSPLVTWKIVRTAVRSRQPSNTEMIFVVWIARSIAW